MPSRIEWTEETWNPIIGCTRCSPACDHCYAVRMAHRLGSNPQTPQYKGLTRMTPDGPDWTGEVRCLEAELSRPLKWRKPRKIFVGSMTDLFHPNVPFEFLDRIFAVMSLCPQHTFQVLTKRPERMREYMERGNRGQLEALSKEVGAKQGYLPWPLPNVWLGTTIWDQPSADKNIPELLGCPAAVRYVSAEPMIGEVDLSKWVGYYPLHEAEKQRGNALPGGGERTDRDQAGWLNLESRPKAQIQMGRENNSDPCSPTEDRRECGGRVQIGQNNDRRGADNGPGASPCLEGHQGADPARLDDKSQERDQVGQFPRQSGAGDVLRTSCSCSECPSCREDRPEWTTQRDVKAERRSGKRDTSEKEVWGVAVVHSKGLRDNISDCEQDMSRGSLGISWLIAGGETGPGARPMHPDWVRSLRDQCEAAGVPFFFKSWGELAPCRLQHIDIAVNRTNGLYHWEFDPECKGDMRRVGKKAAGRVIDGRTWEQFPEVNRG